MLVELVISMSIIAMSFVALLYSQLQSNRLAANARYVNTSKVVLRNLVDRFQTASKTDPILYETTEFTSDANIGIDDEDAGSAGFQTSIYDRDPGSTSDDAFRLLARVDRKVTVAYGATNDDGQVTSNSALLQATFRVTYRPQGGKQDVVIAMSTNRAIP